MYEEELVTAGEHGAGAGPLLLYPPPPPHTPHLHHYLLHDPVI
jgi:hypothetical protein